MVKTAELIDRVSDRIFLERSLCREVVDALILEIKEALADGNDVIMPTFVTFKLTKRNPFFGSIAKTGEKVFYPESNSIKCICSRNFKSCVRNDPTYLPINSDEAIKFREQQEIEKEAKQETNKYKTDYEKLNEYAIKKNARQAKLKNNLYGEEDSYSDFNFNIDDEGED